MQLPEAQVVHRVSGRIRLRISGKRDDTAFFSSLAERMSACPGVTLATANPATGSLVIQHEEAFEKIISHAQAEHLFRLVESSSPAKLRDQMAQGLDETSRNLEKVSGGKVDFDGLLLVGLTGLAIHQAIAGNIMAPAVTLVWYALNAARGTKQ